jgi:transcription initiation factor TFIIIB Brf1 subunit/transcription initiation factor TFIIB
MEINNTNTNLRPDGCVKQIAGKLKTDHKLEHNAVRIAQGISRHGLLEGKNPFTIGGTSVHIASLLFAPDDKKVQIDDIAAMAQLSVSTIRSAYNTIKPDLGSIIPPDLASKEEIQTKLYELSKC